MEMYLLPKAIATKTFLELLASQSVNMVNPEPDENCKCVIIFKCFQIATEITSSQMQLCKYDQLFFKE